MDQLAAAIGYYKSKFAILETVMHTNLMLFNGVKFQITPKLWLFLVPRPTLSKISRKLIHNRDPDKRDPTKDSTRISPPKLEYWRWLDGQCKLAYNQMHLIPLDFQWQLVQRRNQYKTNYNAFNRKQSQGNVLKPQSLNKQQNKISMLAIWPLLNTCSLSKINKYAVVLNPQVSVTPLINCWFTAKWPLFS